MLAYLFWSWPFPNVETAAYEQGQLDFHRALAASKPAGFQASWTFRVDGQAPWRARDARAYEDWYLVDDYAALGPLNDAAVAGICQEPHRRTAAAAAGGIGALYRLRTGRPRVPESVFATWITKGPPVGYEHFYGRAEPLTERLGGSLWRRQMVFGPAPEFCLLSPTRPEPQSVLQAFSVKRTLLQPSRA